MQWRPPLTRRPHRLRQGGNGGMVVVLEGGQFPQARFERSGTGGIVRGSIVDVRQGRWPAMDETGTFLVFDQQITAQAQDKQSGRWRNVTSALQESLDKGRHNVGRQLVVSTETLAEQL